MIYLNVPFVIPAAPTALYSEPLAQHVDILNAYLETVKLEIQQARLRGKPNGRM